MQVRVLSKKDDRELFVMNDVQGKPERLAQQAVDVYLAHRKGRGQVVVEVLDDGSEKAVFETCTKVAVRRIFNADSTKA